MPDLYNSENVDRVEEHGAKWMNRRSLLPCP